MDAGEFTAFFNSTVPALLRYVTRMSDADAAQDIVADTMATMWSKRLDAPDSDESLRKLQSLAFRVAEGHLRNRRRGDRRRGMLFGKLGNSAASELVVRPDFTELLNSDVAVLDRLNSLKATDRNVIALVIDGFTMKEISTILDCSLSATKMRILRARKQLRAALGEEAWHDE